MSSDRAGNALTRPTTYCAPFIVFRSARRKVSLQRAVSVGSFARCCCDKVTHRSPGRQDAPWRRAPERVAKARASCRNERAALHTYASLQPENAFTLPQRSWIHRAHRHPRTDRGMRRLLERDAAAPRAEPARNGSSGARCGPGARCTTQLIRRRSAAARRQERRAALASPRGRRGALLRARFSLAGS